MTAHEQFGMSHNHQQWLRENEAQAIGDIAALQALADKLGVSIEPEPNIFLNDFMPPLPSDRFRIIVNWLPPQEALDLPEHQLELTRSVGQSLLEVKQNAQRHKVNRRGISAFVGGVVAAGIGKSIDNDMVHVGGLTAAALSIAALGWVNGRGSPEAPQLDEEQPAPIRIERS